MSPIEKTKTEGKKHMKRTQARPPKAKAIIDDMRREVYRSGAIRPARLVQKVLEWADKLETEISTPTKYIVDHGGETVPLYTLPVRDPSRRELIKQKKEIDKLIQRVEYLERVMLSTGKPVLSIVDKVPKG